MEFSLRLQGFMEFLQNKNHPAVCCFVKTPEAQGSHTKFHGIKYINL